MKLRTVVVVTAAALSCNTGSSNITPGISSSCSVTLSGAVTGTYDCRPATTAWSSSDDNGVFTFGVGASGARPSVGLAIAWLGEPKDSTYHYTDPGAQAELYVTTSSGATWRATVGGGGATVGSYALTFTSVVNNLSTSTGRAYSTDGTVTATLAADTTTTATGTVTLTATF